MGISLKKYKIAFSESWPISHTFFFFFPVLFCLICRLLYERKTTSHFKWTPTDVLCTWQREALPSLKLILCKLIIPSVVFRTVPPGHCTLIVLKASRAIQKEFSKYLRSLSL